MSLLTSYLVPGDISYVPDSAIYVALYSRAIPIKAMLSSAPQLTKVLILSTES